MCHHYDKNNSENNDFVVHKFIAMYEERIRKFIEKQNGEILNVQPQRLDEVINE
jgi:hypothetical protein